MSRALQRLSSIRVQQTEPTSIPHHNRTSRPLREFHEASHRKILRGTRPPIQPPRSLPTPCHLERMCFQGLQPMQFCLLQHQATTSTPTQLTIRLIGLRMAQVQEQGLRTTFPTIIVAADGKMVRLPQRGKWLQLERGQWNRMSWL